ncbi:MAG: TetR/AcrR family transcriptional regulator [Algoriphagus sp.]|jgi:AcrR family transcriptional regulator|uniref:TetR/AcrR family transcriptional regulator n=1 Tax=Algoriphagus sp. TaxID=1872435 RepID=UPI0027760D46|nr:TetR/AcrR family transcriptional regulator [Algoriphagus sp.]MDP4747774.1 TetR/AcrR family transcriptional regulator [Algoriphagus sp.]MDP4838136.1 TetR/AcrR family transcriptional regulator [Algoriphagus sp.]MDP4903406.1 TetR/AcrR family transcriptional regulator [Algoriphagus sp.]MDP4956656.1 TetR/AcrR family transcriptional regulator [Algoriphagus sp.]
MAGEKNKEKLILDAAIGLFTAQGFAATRMEDVAKKAGISKGLTYFYYKNKEDLFMALTKKAFEQLKEEFRESLRAKGKNGLEMLTDLVQRIWKFSKEQPVYYQSILHFLDLMKKYTSPELKKQINPLILDSIHFHKLLELQLDPIRLGIQMVSQGIKDGSIRPELQAEITFYTIWSMTLGFEKMEGPISFEGKETKVSPEAWQRGFLKLMQDMLKGTIQASKPQLIQASLF